MSSKKLECVKGIGMVVELWGATESDFWRMQRKKTCKKAGDIT